MAMAMAGPIPGTAPIIKPPTEPITIASSTDGSIRLPTPTRNESIAFMVLKIRQHEGTKRAWVLVIEPDRDGCFYL